MSCKGYKHTEEAKLKISLANKGHKYNIGHICSFETRKKISLANQGNKNRLGHHNSKEHNYKISIAQKGQKRKPLSEEHKRKISKSNKGRHISLETKIRIKNTLTGRKRPKEVIEKMRLGNLGRKHSDETKYKISKANKGKHHMTEEMKEHFRKLYKGKKRPKELRQKLSEIVSKRVADGKHRVVSSVHGYFYSNKNKQNIRYDSSYELKALQILENQNNIKVFCRCPYRVTYSKNDGIVHHYTPDILVIYLNDSQEVIEIKPKSLLNYNYNNIKHKEASIYFERKNILFSVWTEDKLYT